MAQKKTINNSIQTQILNSLNTQPHPTRATIIKTYEDGYVDIKTDYGELRHVQSITTHENNDETVLIFLNNNYDERIVI